MPIHLTHPPDPPQMPCRSRFREQEHALCDNAIATGNRPTTGVGGSPTVSRSRPAAPDAPSLSELVAMAEADFVAGRK